MTNPEQPTTSNEHQQQLNDFFDSITQTTRQRASTLGKSIDLLNDIEQQIVISSINPHLRFEMSQRPELSGTPIQATGIGMIYVSDFEGNILGVETLTDDDLVTGTITDICALPTPTVSCLAQAADGEIPDHSQVLSPVLLLDQAIFRSYRSILGTYDNEVDLGNFQVGLPLEHYLRITLE